MSTVTTSELEPIFADYALRLERRQRVRATVVNFVNSVKPFQSWLREQDKSAVDVVEDDLYEYFARGVYAQGTIHLHCVQIRAAYSYALRRGVIRADPFVDFETPSGPTPNPRSKVIPNAELREMRTRCTKLHHQLLWHLLVYTGMRRDEIRRLDWADLDRETATLNIVGKGGKPRVIPCHPELQLLLNTIRLDHKRVCENPLSGAILSPGSLCSEGKPYSNGDGFSKLLRHFTDQPFHSFRKTLASSLARNGVDGILIDKIMGWAPSGIRETYYVAVQFDQLHAAIRKAYLDSPMEI